MTTDSVTWSAWWWETGIQVGATVLVGGVIGWLQQKVTKDIANMQKKLSIDIANMQKELSTRGMLVPLFEKMSVLKELGTKAPAEDAVPCVNWISLVGLCTESGVMDSTVADKAFGNEILKIAKQLRGCEVYNGGTFWKKGSDLLDENPPAVRLIERLEQKNKNQSAIPPMGGVI